MCSHFTQIVTENFTQIVTDVYVCELCGKVWHILYDRYWFVSVLLIMIIL
jgi:hypothetical protein